MVKLFGFIGYATSIAHHCWMRRKKRVELEAQGYTDIEPLTPYQERLADEYQARLAGTWRPDDLGS